ncbi:CHASE domain-containing protein [Oceanimonas sp. CHS3-5]|uniref:CHASE domain-containing protein n=1 Tax=Oceanimonas sp. CHS3-5 TaxID=3068186 RepID=UPI00273ECF39|nr:CHASE domain-containing protein [Oceanimonas sp. CHS3-5]MDP5291978.1 CHASE domain-containing protein [Oceanimonas sp. CHS3-5]
MPLHLNSALCGRWVQLTLAGGLLLSALAAWKLHITNEGIVDQAVGKAAEQAQQAVRERLSLYHYGLSGARGAILSAGEHGINRELFQRYSRSRDIDAEFPGARGFGFIRRVPRTDEAEFTQQARIDGWPDFRIKELSPHQRERYVIQYIEPVDRNIEAVGLDIGSEAHRRAAADAAIRTGDVRITGPITLVQATGNPQQSFLILMPVYEGGETPATQAERQARAYGWSYAPLLMKDVLADLPFNTEATHLELWDVTRTGQEEAFYYTDPADSSLLHTQTAQFDMYGRQWESRFSVRPLFIDNLHLFSPLQLFLLGALVALLAAALTGMISLSRSNRRQIHAEQAQLAAIVESSEDGIISQTLDGRITSWNRGAKRIFGFDASEAMGQRFAELLVPEEFQQEEADITNRVRAGEAIPQFETIRRCRNGDPFHASITMSPLRDSTGRVVGASKTVRDITPQKVAEAKILDLNSNLEAQVAQRTAELVMAAEVAEMGIWSWSLADNTLTWNDRMFELYQLPLSLRRQGLSYEQWRARVHPDDVDMVVASLQAAVNGTGVYEPTFRIVQPGGQIRIMQARAQVVRNAQGVAEQVTGINIDITSQRELETSLRWSKQKADEASQAKSNFLANMSHEIRTPMNAILGMLQLVQKTGLNARQQDYVSKAQSAGRSLLALLNDILDYSKIEAGKLQLEPHLFESEQLLQDLGIVLAGNLADKPVELMFDLDPALPEQLIGDRLRLQQVLINLAGNAIKFTDRGEVVVQVRVTHREDQRARLCFAVTDTGIGIAGDKLERIFEGFTQAEASTTRRFGGTGLGLVISRRLVGLMGGKLKVSSTQGAGSRFWFEVDFGLAGAESVQPALALTQAHILVVDDNRVSSGILEATLSAQGYRVSCVARGEDALTTIDRQTIDLVLLDCLLPGPSGLDIAAQMQARSNPAPIIMITAHEHDTLAGVQRQANPPFSDFLTKPVTTRQLVDAIEYALGRDRAEAVGPAPDSAGTLRLDGLRLLLVEDNAFNRQVAAELLASEGATVSVAEDGLEGVQKVTDTPDAFDVVLMDMQMPHIDGLEATRRIRRHRECATLPILAMTANVSEEDRQACMRAGMNGHLGKPIDADEMVSGILGVMRHAPVTGPRPTRQPPAGIESLDIILKRFGGDVRLYRTMLDNFDASTMAELKTLEARLAEGDGEAVSASLHTLKGMAGTMGLCGLAARFAALEQEVRGHDAQTFTAFDAGTVHELAQQLASGQASLQASLARVASLDDAEQAPSGTLDMAELHEQFESLLELLKAGNLRAVEVVEELALLPHSGNDLLTQLVAEVQKLNFTAAHRIVLDLLENADA